MILLLSFYNRKSSVFDDLKSLEKFELHHLRSLGDQLSILNLNFKCSKMWKSARSVKHICKTLAELLAQKEHTRKL